MAQAAAAAVPPLARGEAEETLPQQEAAKGTEALVQPLERAMESGSPEKIINLFRGRAVEEKAALQRLGMVEPSDAAFPEIVTQVQAANDNAYRNIEKTEQETLQEVQHVMGTTPAEIAKAPVVEAAVKVMPIIAVGEVEPEEVMEAKHQHDVAADVMKENEEALKGFCAEHHVAINEQTLSVNPAGLESLTPVERTYVQVLLVKHAAGKASMMHADALLGVARATSDEEREKFRSDAARFAKMAAVAEAGAKGIETAYLDLPEIKGLTATPESTGASMGGDNFEPPLAAATPPTSPFGPDGRPMRAGTPLYDDTVHGKPPGIADIKPYKSEGGEKVERSFMSKFLWGNLGKLKGFFGMGSEDRT